MKWSFASVGLVAAGLIGVVIILLFQNITVNNEEDYYLLKEISQAAMIDAIDLAHFREYGKLKIMQEKYVENFTRRFADSVNVTNTSNYSLDFYNIMEYPPKASVNISTNIGEYTVFGNTLGAEGTQEYSVGNSLDSIIEIEEIDVTKSKCDEKKIYYAIPYAGYNDGKRNCFPINGTRVLGPETEGDWHVTEIIPIGKIQMLSHTMMRKLKDEEMYVRDITAWEAKGIELTNYIVWAEDLELQKLIAYENSEGHTLVDWEVCYTCRKGTSDFEYHGGDMGHKGELCLLGIIYYLIWHNNECDET